MGRPLLWLAAVAAIAAPLACAGRTGTLAPDPWPTLAEHWNQAPRPAEIERRGGMLTGLQEGVRFEAGVVAQGITRVRVARGELSRTPSLAVLPQGRPMLEGSEAESEAALREALRNLQFSDSGAWRWFRVLETDEAILGLGERPASMHQRGRRAVLWNTDNFSYGPDALRLYQSIPFWISLRRGRARGFLIDNTHRLGFDVGERRSDQLEVAAPAGDFDLYQIEGPSLGEVLERFSALTGRPAMPPLWALGYQQSRRSYSSQDAVLRVAQAFRETRIPCDAIHLDASALGGARNLEPSGEQFPTFPQMIEELADQGLRLIVGIEPGVAREARFAPYREGAERRFFVKESDGDELVGRTASGLSVFPDFTRDDVRAWWGSLHEPLVRMGVAGFCNDRNEPTVLDGLDKTLAEDARHEGYGGGSHAQFHNVYGMLMSAATREGLLKAKPQERPFILSRASYAGGQRVAATWTGENAARWPELARSIAMTLNLGLSGQPFAGPDIGGFHTNMEKGLPPFPDVTPELYARWLEFGALLPIARSNTIQGSMDREPFAFGEPWTSIHRKSIERRYRLLPLLYTLAEEAHRTGAPVARPLLWICPDDDRALQVEDQFLLGNDLMVAPIVESRDESRMVYLPAGTWFRFDPAAPEARAVAIEGGRAYEVPAPFGALPVFARAGAIVPLALARRNSAGALGGPLELEVFEGKGELALYEDAGDGWQFELGAFARTRFRSDVDGAGQVLFVEARQGAWPVAPREVTVRFRSRDGVRTARFLDDGRAREVRPASR